MGVKNLWSQLSSSSQVITVGSAGSPVIGSNSIDDLEEQLGKLQLVTSGINNVQDLLESGPNAGTLLSGKAVAIDLSCWVCDSQANQNMHSVTKPHLRNLLFRTWSLLSVGVLPVFVVEGVAPELKQATMKARNATRGGGNSTSTGVKKATRSRFNSVLRECCELFRLVGVPWVQAAGEAEATCAALYYNKLVQGIITEDSDVLLYGGDNVLRNFSVQANRPTADYYTVSDLSTKLQLSVSGLIVLSLLLGCDYLPAGVPGVGTTAAMQLLDHWRDIGVDALERFESWSNKSFDSKAPKPKMKKSGTPQELESAVMYRAVHTPGFPFNDVTAEFQARLNISAAELTLEWQRPDYEQLVSWCCLKLGWEEDYSRQKAGLLCARWLVCHDTLDTRSMGLQAEHIVKTCVRGGVESYLIRWKSAGSGSLETVEPQRLVMRSLPGLVRDLVEREELKRNAKKKGKKKNKTTAANSLVDKEEGKISKPPRAKSAKSSGKQLKLTEMMAVKGPSHSITNSCSSSASGSKRQEKQPPMSNSCSSSASGSKRQEKQPPMSRDRSDNKKLQSNQLVTLDDSDDEIETTVLSNFTSRLKLPNKSPEELKGDDENGLKISYEESIIMSDFDCSEFCDSDDEKDEDVSLIIDRFIKKKSNDVKNDDRRVDYINIDSVPDVDKENVSPELSLMQRARFKLKESQSSVICKYSNFDNQLNQSFDCDKFASFNQSPSETKTELKLCTSRKDLPISTSVNDKEIKYYSKSKANLKSKSNQPDIAEDVSLKINTILSNHLLDDNLCKRMASQCKIENSIEKSLQSCTDDRSMDMFDEEIEPEFSNNCTGASHEISTTKSELVDQSAGCDDSSNILVCSPQELIYDDVAQSNDTPYKPPCFKLFDSGWLDSESFLCTPPTKPNNSKRRSSTSLSDPVLYKLPSKSLDDNLIVYSETIHQVLSRDLSRSNILQSVKEHTTETPIGKHSSFHTPTGNIVSVLSPISCKHLSVPQSTPVHYNKPAQSNLLSSNVNGDSPLTNLAASAGVNDSSILSLSPLIEQLSLAERMKIRFGKKKIATLLSE